jgi:hypothetical protein
VCQFIMKFPADMAERIRTLIRTDKLVDGKLEIFFEGGPGRSRLGPMEAEAS